MQCIALPTVFRLKDWKLYVRLMFSLAEAGKKQGDPRWDPLSVFQSAKLVGLLLTNQADHLLFQPPRLALHGSQHIFPEDRAIFE